MQTSAAAARIRRRRAMLAARTRGGRRSGALVASRCAANKRALSATPQARLLGQCELARWELGPANGLHERSDRPAVTFWAHVKRLRTLQTQRRHRAGSTICSIAGRADARALVRLRLVRAARACLRVGGANWLRAAPVSQGVGEGLWASWLRDSEGLCYIQRNSGGREGGLYLGRLRAPARRRNRERSRLSS